MIFLQRLTIDAHGDFNAREILVDGHVERRILLQSKLVAGGKDQGEGTAKFRIEVVHSK